MSWHGLSDAEYDLMQLFWQDGAEDTYTLNEVIAFMKTKGHVWKQQTAHTVLTTLIGNGVLQSKKIGFRKFYSIKLTQEEYLSQWTKGMIQQDYGGSLTNFLVAFTGGKALTEKEAKELHDFLDQ